jgi:hypothetical protein
MAMSTRNGSGQDSTDGAIRTVPDPKRDPVTTKTVEKLSRDPSFRDSTEIARKYARP